MKVEELKEVLEENEILYRYNDTLRLWQVMIDDVIVYIAPKTLELLNIDEFGVYLSTQMMLGIANISQKEITLH